MAVLNELAEKALAMVHITESESEDSQAEVNSLKGKVAELEAQLSSKVASLETRLKETMEDLRKKSDEAEELRKWKETHVCEDGAVGTYRIASPDRKGTKKEETVERFVLALRPAPKGKTSGIRPLPLL